MKYIFDFDDVLSHTTKRFKEHVIPVLEKDGVSRNQIEEYFKSEQWNLFSFKKMLAHFSLSDLYEEIMQEVKFFTNKELVREIEKIGKHNCYIVTYGDEEFQLDKIERTGIASLFSEIIVVSRSKKEAVEKLAGKHRDEEVVFIDDKSQNFEDLDFEKYPNLKTILFTNTAQLRDALPGLFRHK